MQDNKLEVNDEIGEALLLGVLMHAVGLRSHHTAQVQ